MAISKPAALIRQYSVIEDALRAQADGKHMEYLLVTMFGRQALNALRAPSHEPSSTH